MNSLNREEFQAAKQSWDALPEEQKINQLLWRLRGYAAENNITAEGLEVVIDVAVVAFAAMRNHNVLAGREAS